MLNVTIKGQKVQSLFIINKTFLLFGKPQRCLKMHEKKTSFYTVIRKIISFMLGTASSLQQHATHVVFYSLLKIHFEHITTALIITLATSISCWTGHGSPPPPKDLWLLYRQP